MVGDWLEAATSEWSSSSEKMVGSWRSGERDPMTSTRPAMGTDSHNWHLDLVYDQWVALPVSGSRPAARYKTIQLCPYDKATVIALPKYKLDL
ncbi:unnamed protein product [Ilex paraguariensis]|uniref:Uncharacterized protein n=1 Tax=Ilex paraguariensis TaxID=185542 RepID=A0ABC8U886_9AQUA